MKLAVFSDPHIDIQMKRGYPYFLNELNQYLKNLHPDLLLVTGDVASSTKYIQKFLEGINIDSDKKIFCPGNHDIWVNSNAYNASWNKYYQILPELCKLYNWHYLPKHPLIIDNVSFAGTIGWYDYSSRNPRWDSEVSLDKYKSKFNEVTGGIWMDREFAKFGNYEDKMVANHFSLELLEDINRISSNLISKNFELSNQSLEIDMSTQQLTRVGNKKLDTIVIGTHIVPFLDFVRFSGSLDWDYFSAFIGNKTLGDIIYSISNNIRKIAVFGHTHFFQRKQIRKNLEAICCPIGYPIEWEKNQSNLQDLFESRIVMVDV